ncbi:hypothetical protein GHT06_004447 [Daphnia sinensis]|uniref:Uncharacterized protein n=1 Tax=Daphnia sinensis TaxID=1820382 RepID=A0AAD5PNJ2_9CRUS|nr:hypothetical protein GHT06_004447 [Daphnia sinensis]
MKHNSSSSYSDKEMLANCRASNTNGLKFNTNKGGMELNIPAVLSNICTDKKKKKLWKASFILGSIGLVLGKLGLFWWPSFEVLDETAITEATTAISTTVSTTPTATTDTTSSTTSTTSATTSTTTTTDTTTTTTSSTSTTSTTTTTTTTTTMMPMTCTATTRATTGSYKTVRTPGRQVEQCLSITVTVGSKIEIVCTSIYVSAGTYVKLFDTNGTNLVADPPVLNQTYTSSDNTMIIKSLASSANADQVCCTWKTV